MTGTSKDYIAYRISKSDEIFEDADFIDFDKETVLPLIRSVEEFSKALKLLLEE